MYFKCDGLRTALRMTLKVLVICHMTLLLSCRYSPVEGSMKPAGLLSASAAEPLFPFLTLLARTDCGCQPSSLILPHCSQQRKD